jgi:hypothetical protein
MQVDHPFPSQQPTVVANVHNITKSMATISNVQHSSTDKEQPFIELQRTGHDILTLYVLPVSCKKKNHNVW